MRRINRPRTGGRQDLEPVRLGMSGHGSTAARPGSARGDHRTILPPLTPRPQCGRRRLLNRKVLSGILFVLRTGIPWEYLPQEPGYGSGMTCWRRLRDWQTAGVWERLHHELLNRLLDAGQIDRSRAALDSASIPAKRGGDLPGTSPMDRGKWHFTRCAPQPGQRTRQPRVSAALGGDATRSRKQSGTTAPQTQKSPCGVGA